MEQLTHTQNIQVVDGGKTRQWYDNCLRAAVRSPQTQVVDALPSGASYSFFSTQRTLGYDDTTQWTLTLSTIDAGLYRFAWSAGTAPALRPDRGLTPTGRSYTWSSMPNGVVVLTSATPGDFAAVRAGDSLYVPGLVTGDPAGPFSEGNAGFYMVLAASGTALQMSRDAGWSPPVQQTVTAASNTDLQAFGPAGVQRGDQVALDAGFAPPVLHAEFQVASVTPRWFEVRSTALLPSGVSAVPQVAGLAFYQGCKRWVLVAADQLCVVQANGNSGTSERIQPLGGDGEEGEYQRQGPTWSLSVTNWGVRPAKVTVLSWE